MGFILRWLCALGLLSATYNPTDWNYIRWVGVNWAEKTPMAVLLGLLLFVAYVVYLRATLRSIGGFGMGLILAVFAALIWVLVDSGLLSLDNPGMNTWLAIFALSLVLGIGLSWSLVRRKLSGQADVDDVDE